MKRFLTAAAEGRDWRTATNACLDALGETPPEANLGFVYVTDRLADELGAIVRLLRTASGVAEWVGTVGVGICLDDREYYDSPAVGIMVATFPEDAFRVFPTLDTDLANLVDNFKPWYSQDEQHFAVVHGDPRSGTTPDQIPLLAETVPRAYLVGGLTSSQTGYAQYANGLCEGGLSGVLFSGEVPVAASLTQGCSPIGRPHRITESRRNVIMGLDGRPALDVFKEDIGEVLARDISRVAGYIFVGLPADGPDLSDYVVRNLLGVDSRSGQLMIGDLVRPGQSVLFCRRDGPSAWDNLNRMVRSLRRRADAPIRGALYFSCLGRGRQLFGEGSAELKTIQRELGNVPLAGFFANGEIARGRLYGYTGVLALFL
ncbi:MAG: histidine kinase [Gammaproteobacteria bacterium]|nr:histidine kinase [Gammaproteobacteria bacterium]NIR99246.1 histidine kinase [Gammaproteobacteria bacterium]NIT64867.1 histidine kinase [Gammaproteobacteria bacterium]NIV21817.1 histidine kinase [Gammaproteobacteria bacterium]NIX10886.1 histidine kinase [Gammaproteobacteria bacterium]